MAQSSIFNNYFKNINIDFTEIERDLIKNTFIKKENIISEINLKSKTLTDQYQNTIYLYIQILELHVWFVTNNN